MNKTVITVRWIARILSVLIFLFWGFLGWFIATKLNDNREHSLRALTASDCIGFGTMLLSLLGLAIAWRWELIGAVVTFAAVSVAVLINPDAVTGLGMLPPINALLFIFCWESSRPSQPENVA